jgi:hypothetical protein
MNLASTLLLREDRVGEAPALDLRREPPNPGGLRGLRADGK